MKKVIVYGCQVCRRVTSSTNEKIVRDGVCFRCRLLAASKNKPVRAYVRKKGVYYS